MWSTWRSYIDGVVEIDGDPPAPAQAPQKEQERDVSQAHDEEPAGEGRAKHRK